MFDQILLPQEGLAERYRHLLHRNYKPRSFDHVKFVAGLCPDALVAILAAAFEL